MRKTLCISKNIRQTGSVTLPAAMTSALGVVFALVFYNLANYVTARNAVEQAARIASRCLVVTDDPRCREYAPTPVPAAEKEHIRGIPQRPRIEIKANLMEYSAAVFEETWEASYQAYNIQKVLEPDITFEKYRVPQKTFGLSLNRGERHIAGIKQKVIEPQFYSVSIPSFRPKYLPNFPSFDRGYESANKYHDFDAWIPQNSGNNHPQLQMMTSSWSKLRLEPNAPEQAHVFKVGPIQIPELLSDSERQILFKNGILESEESLANLCEQGQTCSSAELARGNAPWWSDAYLSIKVMGHFKNVGNRTGAVRWARRHSNRRSTQAGLWVQVFEPGEPIPNIDNPFHLVATSENNDGCLGGSVGENIRKGESRWYNLYVRGPSKSHGGTPVSHVCANKLYHDNIKVPRGGHYIIWAMLQVDNAPMEADVQIKHYFDDFDRIDRLETHRGEDIEHIVSCGKVVLKKSQKALSCPRTLAECNKTSARNLHPESVLDGKCWDDKVEIEPLCVSDNEIAEDDTIFPVSAGPDAHCGQDITIPLCHEGETPCSTPSGKDYCYKRVNAENHCVASLPHGIERDNRIVCGWEETDDRVNSLQVCSISDCPAAALDKYTVTRNCHSPRREVTLRPKGDYGVPDHCSTTNSILRECNEQRPLDNSHFPQTVVSDLKSTKAKLSSLLCSYTPRDENGKTLKGKDVITPTPRNKTTSKNKEKIYEHLNSNWKPALSYFSLKPAPGCKGPMPSPSKLDTLQITKTASKKKLLDTTDIFGTSPVWEIPAFLPTEENLSKCSAKNTPLEERLRMYIKKTTKLRAPLPKGDPRKEIDNLRLERVGNGKLVDTRVVSVETQCEDAGIDNGDYGAPPLCTPTRKGEQKLEACLPHDYLGIWPKGEMPASCKDGTYLECYSEAVVRTWDLENMSQQEPEPALHTRAVRNYAFRELQNRLGSMLEMPAGKNCSAPKCAEVEVSIEDTNTARVQVSYQMPLAFPLDLFMGEDTVRIRHEKREYLEAEIVGRK